MNNRFNLETAHVQRRPNDHRELPLEAEAVSLWRRLEKVVADHPKQSLLGALAAGAVLGWITKRR